MLSKAEIRERVKRERAGLDPGWVRETSRAVQDSARKLPEFRDAAVIGCYMAMAAEVQTDALLLECRETGKTVCVPARCPETGGYRLTVLKEGTSLAAGYMGIEEPTEKTWIAVEDVDFIIVPGLAFDSRGGRVGYGGGNYDRILAPEGRLADCFKVGLGFGFQLFDRVPAGETDVLMDAVVTEKEVLRMEAQRDG